MMTDEQLVRSERKKYVDLALGDTKDVQQVGVQTDQ